MTTTSINERTDGRPPHGGDFAASAHQSSVGVAEADSHYTMPIVERRRTERRKQNNPVSVASKSGRDSLFLRAVAVFVILDVVLSLLAPISFDKWDYPYKGWAWWTFNELRDSAQSENVALMGSSLI